MAHRLRLCGSTDLPLVAIVTQGMGKNSTLATDIFGRRFVTPVDAEHKQDVCGTNTLCVFANPHMKAFHTSWFGFFTSFYSTFAAAALGAYIIPDLDLTDAEWGLSGTMAVMGTIFFRLVMGVVCDTIGARKGLGALLLGTIPAIILMMFVNKAWQFIFLRCVIGFSLATFVACQTWCSQMFSKKVVGIANATAAGWGNLGGGVTNLTMPLVFLLMMSFTDQNESLSWRLCYIVPAILHLMGGLWVLTARDLPDGNFKELELSGAKQKSSSKTVTVVGFTNINAWIFTLTYGMCFGVELTMNNVGAKYFYTYHGLTPAMAGLCASMWGMMNLFARTLGGWISDVSNKKYGIRGRLWSTWAVQTVEGIMCILLGSVTIGYDAPHSSSVGGNIIEAWTDLGSNPLREAVGLPSGWINLNATCYDQITDKSILTIKACNTLNYKMTDEMRSCLSIDNNVVSMLRKTAPFSAGGPDFNCVSNAGAIPTVMVLIVCFSLCVQAAEGLHYGVVPYISRQALGVVSGMVGAGGNAGAVIAGNIFFTGNFRTDEGIINMGYMIIGITALIIFMYFPGEDGGGMFFKAGALGKYDPQIIKPPADYRGADSMDFAEAARRMSSNPAEKDAAEVTTTTSAA
jgi:NNP family nitrate/nitrite transporter-like MFS transporter